MSKSTIILALLVVANSLHAQKIATAQFSNWKPRSIGPAGMSGRITSIDALHSNPDIIYLGSASGGVCDSVKASGLKNQPDLAMGRDTNFCSSKK